MSVHLFHSLGSLWVTHLSHKKGKNKKGNSLFHQKFAISVSGKLPTYPSPKPSFFPKRELSVNVSLGEG